MDFHLCLLRLFLLFQCILAPFTAAIPTQSPCEELLVKFNNTWYTDPNDGEEFRLVKRANQVPLRILPLGASITWGQSSESGNGYRKPLRDQLRFYEWEVNMVGSKSNGNMVDNDVEANPGDTVDQVKAATARSYALKPNVVTINAGINDCARSIDIPNVGRRMRSLIETILAADGWNRTTIVLSTLTPSQDGNVEAHRGNVNGQYRSLVTDMQQEGKRIVLADMDPPAGTQGHGWLSYPSDYGDAIHPNDKGFLKMAFVWWAAINSAHNKGYLQSPYPIDPGEINVNCHKKPGDGVSAGGLTQQGNGLDDGIYYHNSVSMGTVLTVQSDFDRDQWFFAKLYSRDRDDLVGWFEQNDGTVTYGCWRNTGSPNPNSMFKRIADVNVKNNCAPSGVHFVDINGDGFDDFVCIGEGGEAFASINNRDGTDTQPPSFTSLGSIKDAIPGYDRSRVLLGDLDGDGRVDYCVMESNGDISCWRNGGIGKTGNKPAYWEALGKRFTGNNIGDLNGVRFVDVNGDGRDDWIWVGDIGQVYTYTNSRSCLKGKLGDGLNVAWRQGFYTGTSSGPTHRGIGVAGIRSRIHFARIFGEPQDFGLLGRHDYVYMAHKKETNGKHTFSVNVWKNTGYGSTKPKADGDRYCNMMGHSGGLEDYVWILSKGQMTMYPNAGLSRVVPGQSFWGPETVIWDPATQAGGRSLDRRDLHLADWDGDGLCDIIWTDPENENRVQLWRNRYKETGGWSWAYNANPASDLYCPQSRGLGIHDIPVHFADVSGNGKADYLCMEKDGRTWGFVNGDSGWEYIDQFKHTENLDRADLQFADVDGDGKADLVWTDKFTGDGHVYYNGGRQNVGGSRFLWDNAGYSYTGNAAGTCTYYPDLNGDGRADQHCITGSFTNQAITSFNKCAAMDHEGDDSSTGTSPNLPVMPGMDPDGGWDDSPNGSS